MICSQPADLDIFSGVLALLLHLLVWPEQAPGLPLPVIVWYGLQRSVDCQAALHGGLLDLRPGLQYQLVLGGVHPVCVGLDHGEGGVRLS